MTNEKESRVWVDNYAEHLNVIETLKTRSLISHCSNEEALIKITAKKKITAYLGVDCTADSLHVGHVIPLMVARWLLRFGHNIVILLGGATTRIGDPSGKDKTRPQLEDQVIKNNMEAIKSSLEHFLRDTRIENAEAEHSEESLNELSDLLPAWGTVKFVDNAEWFDQIKYVDFLRDYGKYFSVSEMLSLDSVKERLDRELPMNFTEFNYSLLQAYDFLELNRRYDCILQIGGSDQWGNISRGISLGKRFDKELFGITTPLLMNKEGRKMGKTAKGAVWLNKDKLSAYGYAMFFRNVPDDLFDDWWGYFTEPDTTTSFDWHYREMTFKDSSALNDMKAVLACRAVDLCRGQGMLSTWPDQFGYGKNDIKKGLRLCDVLLRVGFAESLGRAKSLIEQGAVSLTRLREQDIYRAPSELCGEGETIRDITHIIGPEYFVDSSTGSRTTDYMVWLKVGKKRNSIIFATSTGKWE